MARTARILNRREVPSMDPTRRGQLDVIITYEMETLGIGNVVISKAEDNDTAIAAAIKAQVDRLATLRSRELTID